jgi:hypothetical protein
MNPAENIEKQIRNFYAAKKSSVTTSVEMDKKIIDDASQAFEKSNKANTNVLEPTIWRTTMKSKIIKFAAAAVIIIAVILGLSTILDHGATPAYAVEQTIEAIKKIETVYMKGEFYNQGEFECWMKFDGNPDKPTHVWLGRFGHNMCKICSPAGVFGLNKRTKAVHFARRDERGKDWFIKFGSFFEDAVKKANRTDSVEIYNEKVPETDRELIVVHIKTSKREQMFLVDPGTKLPLGFSTIRDDAPMEMMRKTLAVKNLTKVRYNKQPPEGIFEMPADAVIVEEEVDAMVDPDSGLIADGMTREQACLEIVKQTAKALIELDIPKLKSLDLFYRLYPDWIWDKIKAMKQSGPWVAELPITGEPYQEEELWYVPCQFVYTDGKTEPTTPMIKFYEMEGKTYCFIIGSKEKGVVD